MTARLTLLAHAETAATRRAAFARDEDLDARGRAALAAIVPPRCDRALTSPAPAACQTAQALGLAPVTDTALRDLEVGTWEGLGLADISDVDPAGFAAFATDPDFAGHGGESISALIARVDAWLEARLEERGRLVAVTHAAVMRAAAVAVLGANSAAFWRLDVPPLAALDFSSDGRRWTLRAGAVRF